ncbi:MAG: DUF3658 domain-containing protein [Xanthobacteraceae bacterium]
MSALSQSELDSAIFSALANDWCKTALVIAKVLHACEDQGITITDGQIFDRITNLVNSGRVNSRGVLTNWRCSEILSSEV